MTTREESSRQQWAIYTGLDFSEHGLSEEEEWIHASYPQEDPIVLGFSHHRVLKLTHPGHSAPARSPESASDVRQLNIRLSLIQQELTNCMDLLRGMADSIDQLSETRVTAINSIGNSAGFQILNRPLFVSIEEDENEVVASAPELQASGFGSTDSEAIDDLKIVLGRLYQDLSETPDHELGKLPLAWRRLLMGIVGTNGTTSL